MVARFVRFTESEKTAIVMVKENPLILGGGTPVYVDAHGVRSILGDSPEKGDSFDLPDNVTLVDLTWIDPETEETVTATTKEGVVLKTLAMS